MSARFTHVRAEYLKLDEAVRYIKDAQGRTGSLKSSISMGENGLCTLELSWSSAVPAATFATLAIVTGRTPKEEG